MTMMMTMMMVMMTIMINDDDYDDNDYDDDGWFDICAWIIFLPRNGVEHSTILYIDIYLSLEASLTNTISIIIIKIRLYGRCVILVFISQFQSKYR